MRPVPARLTLHALIALCVLTHTCFNGTRMTLSLAALKWGATPALVGALMALYALLPMLLGLAAGRWVDRIGARRPMLLGTAFLGLGVALSAAWPALPALFLTSAVSGVAFMIFQVAVQHVVGALGTPDRRPRNFSLLALGFSTSATAGPLLAGEAIDRFGHGSAFLVLAVMPLVAALVIARDWVRFPRPHAIPAPAAEGRTVLDLLREPRLRRALVVSGLLSMGWDLHTFFIPIYGSAVGLSASQIGLVLGAFAAATFVVRLAMPLIVRYLTEWQVLTGALFVGGGTYFLFPLTTSVALLTALSFVLGLGLGAGQPMVMAVMHNVVPEGRVGEALGLRTTIINSTHVALPLLFGTLGTALGLAPLFWSVGTFLAAGGWFARRRPVG